MTEKHAFVTGGTGFTGGNLCKHLRGAGYEVTALVRPGRHSSELESLGVRQLEGDLKSADQLQEAVHGADVVFHIAAAFREARLPDSEYFRVNVDGTRHLITAAAAAGVSRFVHCSTIGVHGDTGTVAATEEAPFKLPDKYCESKLEGELLARELFEKYSLPGVVFRPFGIYGPGDTRFLKLFRSIRRGRFFMIGDGNTSYQLSHIDDLCRGILLCGEHPGAVGEVFLLGGDEPTTLNELVEAVAEAVDGKVPSLRVPLLPVMAAARLCAAVCRPLGIEPPLYPRRVEFFTKDRAADVSKAKRVLGFEPQVSLKEGIRDTAEWYREQGWL